MMKETIRARLVAKDTTGTMKTWAVVGITKEASKGEALATALTDLKETVTELRVEGTETQITGKIKLK